MARLILLNGPPSSGKSTLARRFVDDHPLALCLDIDVVRAMLGRWLDRPTEAGLIAREMAKGMAAVQLEGDRDVIVPQYVGRLPFVEQLDALAVRTGAAFVEVALLPSKAAAVAWFARRAAAPETAAHHDAQALVDRTAGGTARTMLEEMHDALVRVISQRPRTRVIAVSDGEPEQAYRGLLVRLAG